MTVVNIVSKYIENKQLEKQLLDNYWENLGNFADLVLQEAQNNLKKNKSINTGQLLKSGRVELNKENFEAWIIFSAPYAAYVEFGTRAHTAPLGPSLKDFRVVSGRGENKGRQIVRITKTPDPSTNPLDYYAYRKGKKEGIIHKKYGVHTKFGFGLWKKIMQKGTDPHPFLRPAIITANAYMKWKAET